MKTTENSNEYDPENEEKPDLSKDINIKNIKNNNNNNNIINNSN